MAKAVEIVMVQSVAEHGQHYYPGCQLTFPIAKAREWERLGWCRIVQPRESETQTKERGVA